MKVQNQILCNINKETLNERSSWKRITGPRVKSMDQKYQDQIIYKLIPVLKDYDIEMNTRGYNKGPGSQTYIGYDSEGNRILFVFSNANREMDPYEKKRWTMFVRIFYKGKAQDVGMIDLNNTDNVNKAFSLITQTLEDMGFKLKDEEQKEEKGEEEDEDPNVKSLIDYKNSLSESELQKLKEEVEVDE